MKVVLTDSNNHFLFHSSFTFYSRKSFVQWQKIAERTNFLDKIGKKNFSLLSKEKFCSMNDNFGKIQNHFLDQMHKKEIHSTEIL